MSKLRADLVWCLIFSIPLGVVSGLFGFEQGFGVYGYLLFAASLGFALSDRFNNGLEAVLSAFKCGAVIQGGLWPLMMELPALGRLTWGLAAFASCIVILAVRYAWLLGAKSVRPDGLTRLVGELCSDAKARPPVRQA